MMRGGDVEDEVKEEKGLTVVIPGAGQIEPAIRRTFDMSLEQKLAEPKPDPMRRKATGFMPLQGQILVRMCTQEEMSESGELFIPETAREKPMEGVVMAASAGRFDRGGFWVKSEVEPGDRVLYGKYSGSAIVLRGEEMRLMKEEELLGLIR